MEAANFSMKTRAILEVFAVTFIFVPFLTLGIYQLFPAFESWQTETLGFPFPVFVYLVMIALPLTAMLLQHKKPTDYGLSFKPVNYHFNITATCFIPVVLANMPFGLGVDYTTWGGALILTIVQVGLILVLGFILQKIPSLSIMGLTVIGVIAIPRFQQIAGAANGHTLAIFLAYAFFVGFGEEILYRGYMQSRLNDVFGKPYQFFKVTFGWGAIFTALFFGLTHVGLLRWMLGLSGCLTWAWGFWTVFSGLVLGFVREKSGSILAPALLHGLPQAIAAVLVMVI